MKPFSTLRMLVYHELPFNARGLQKMSFISKADIFSYIFLNKNVIMVLLRLEFKIAPTFIHEGQIENNSA